MKKLILLVLLVLTLTCKNYYAEQPIIISFEGTFTNEKVDGPSTIHGAKDIEITIRTGVDIAENNQGTIIWREVMESVRFDNGYMSVELGKIITNPLFPRHFDISTPSVVLSISGIPGEVNMPIRHQPYAIIAKIAIKAHTVSANGILGDIPSSKIRGDFTHITGLGNITSTTNLQSSLFVAEDLLVVDQSLDGVGIMTTMPQFPLDVNGTINATALYINGVSITPNFSKWTPVTTGIHYSNGNVGIGLDNPQASLHVNGTSKLMKETHIYDKLVVTGDTKIGTNASIIESDKADLAIEGNLNIRGNLYNKGIIHKQIIANRTAIDWNESQRIQIVLDEITTANIVQFEGHPVGPANLLMVIKIPDSIVTSNINWKFTGKNILWSGQLKPKITPGPNTDIVSFYYDGIDTYYGVGSLDFGVNP